MIIPFLFFATELVLVDTEMSLKTALWLGTKANLFLATRAKCVCYTE